MSREKIESSLTYGNETAKMGTPAAEKLIEKMVRDIHPELKGGNMAGGIRIEIKRVEGLNLKFKDKNTILTMETYLKSADVARLHNLSRLGVAISAVIESPQAEMDLRIEEINTVTGELWRPKAPAAAGAGDPRD